MKEGTNERVRIFNLTPFTQKRVAKWLMEKYEVESRPRVKGKYKSAEVARAAYYEATNNIPKGSLVLVGGNLFIHQLASRDSRFTICIPHVEHGYIIDVSVMKNVHDNNGADPEGV